MLYNLCNITLRIGMKKINFTNNILLTLLGCTLLFTGCTEEVVEKEQTKKNVGHFVSVFDHTVQYQCDDEVIALSEDGEFSCQSFPIAFYMDEVKLGEISSIHSDGYVFPQDMIALEELSQPIYTSDDSMEKAVLP